jgi:NAD-dependent dihydropyrimidine dehydrogenase PreA subunit
MGLFWGRQTDQGYEPSWLHQWLKPQVSGNIYNGVGEVVRRRPKPLYHQAEFSSLVTPFVWVQRVFYFRFRLHPLFWKVGSQMKCFTWRRFNPVAEQQQTDTPENWTQQLKALALSSGADVVGVTRFVADDFLYDGYQELKAPVIIMFGRAMNYQRQKGMKKNAWRRALVGIDTIAHYNAGTDLVHAVSNWIRQQGYNASGSSGPYGSPVNMVPAAIAAGLGELGKHGSLINREIGANMRLSYVLTDMPLLAMPQDEFDVDDFCSCCRVCEKACPADAIGSDKQMVRGVERWHVDFDKCLPFFNDNFGCGICVNVCPWSVPGQQDKLMAKMTHWKTKQQQKTRA